MRAFFLALWISTSLAGQEPSVRWIYYTSDQAPVKDFAPYSLLVLDSIYHPPLDPLRKQGKTVLGYISLGEIEKFRPWFKEVKKEGILLEENENWPGSYMVDLRDSRWRERVINDLIPQILHKGFEGLHFDTLDNAEYLEEKDPKKYAGMVDAAVEMVQEIRRHYPDIPIMLQRAYPVLLRAANDVDFALAEDLVTQYDFDNKKYLMQSKKIFQKQVDILHEAKRINPKLGLFSLDYWNPSQKEKVKEIYRIAREQGINPYVGTIDLHRIIPEPK